MTEPRALTVRARVVVVAGLATWSGLSCQSDPLRQRAVTHELRVMACAAGCPLPPPDSTPITEGDRGDTVVVFLEVRNALPGLVEVALRGLCAENVAVLAGAAVVRQIPSPVTCPDSTLRRSVEPVLGNTEKRYFRWFIDSGLVTGAYLMEARILLEPRILPQLFFTVR